MFLSNLDLQALPRPDQWALTKDLIWQDKAFGRLVAPRFMITDLASIPMVIRNIPFLDPDGRSRRAAAMHDALYRLGRPEGKDFADRFLKAALIAEGCSHATASAFYAGVHLFGGSSWRSDGELTPGSAFLTPEAFQKWRLAGARIAVSSSSS